MSPQNVLCESLVDIAMENKHMHRMFHQAKYPHACNDCGPGYDLETLAMFLFIKDTFYEANRYG